MLYEIWRATAERFGREIALTDAGSGQRWSFRELALQEERLIKSDDLVRFPQGHSVNFVLTLLNAWRHGKLACPLEISQSAPPLENLPTGCIHLTTTSASTGKARVVAFTGQQLLA